MSAVGLVFSNIHDQNIPDLTRKRTMASVPFGCRYRLIDFTLSNMVNSGITKVGVITHNNYQSLLDHIGTGKDWDLARRSGGIKLLPPFITSFSGAGANKLYSTRLEAMMGAMDFISRCNEDYVVLSDCDAISNIDLSDVIRQHKETGADITVVTTTVDTDNFEISSGSAVITSDENNRISDVVHFNHRLHGMREISTNIIVATRSYLQSAVADASSHGYTSFYSDVIDRNLLRANYFVYHYDGFFAQITSLAGYYACNMKLLENNVRASLFGERNRPILTKVRNSAPTRYADGAKVTNSLIADGCVIEGVVENSIIFRGVKVGKGSVVKNCILMQDTVVGNDVSLGCVVSDKNVLIKDGRNLSGHSTLPFFIGKGTMI
ncbi:MAG: glucose-1-phosphate adenylyltransferase subunit GlgD [Ruminococcaceae bacterium]|nr:glucose-1-phosphate adenylyltransferase subunit GlgD [Oscillospiraceae bacterium]